MQDRPATLLQNSLLRLVRRGAWGHARKFLDKSHPADIAYVLDRLTPADRKSVFDLISADEVRAEVLSLLEFTGRTDLLAGLDPAVAARLLVYMSPDDAALILRELPREHADEILEHMGESAEGVESLLGYPEDTAGAIMTPECFALSEDLTVKEAIERLQQKGEAEASFYVYVVDDRNHLVGVLSLRQIIMQPPYTLLRDCMVTDPVRVTADTDQEEVSRIVARYDLLAVPVVNPNNQLAGVVTVDDVIDVMREEATEDILKMAGTTVEEASSPGVFRGAWIRFPWLVASFFGGLVAVGILGQFEGLLQKWVKLAFFMPIILGMGGNVGNQCAMVVVRGLATGRIDLTSLGRIVRYEIGTALLLGVAFAVGLGLVATLLGYAEPRFPVVVGLGIFASIIIAAALGTFIPLFFDRMSIDPAIASGPLVTTSADVMGIGGFFLVAYMLL
jgi:magnesium transporter